jgi:biotin carboxyl carrier protein
MEIRLSYLNKIYAISMEQEKDGYFVLIDKKKYRVKDISFQDYKISFRISDRKYTMHSTADASRSYLSYDGEYYFIEQVSATGPGVVGAADQKANSVSSPMPGLLVKVPVTVGESVKDGQTLAIVEAMKMQNELRAARDGVVKKVNFKEGEQVDAFQPIVELEVEEIL